MSNVLEKIEHLAEYVTFSHFCDQFLNLSSIDSSRNVTLYFLLDISIFQGRNYKKNKNMLVQTIDEKFELYRHNQKSKQHCFSSKTFQNKSLKHRNWKIPGDCQDN